MDSIAALAARSMKVCLPAGAALPRASCRRSGHGLRPATHGWPFRRQRSCAGIVNSRTSGPGRPCASCPDHFLRTKIRPLVVAFDPGAPDVDAVLAGLADQVAAYRGDYAFYYERCKRADSPAMRDPNAVVYLVPGVGMITFAKDKATARISGEFYINAINVMRGALRYRPIRACPNRRRSTSNTGCWKSQAATYAKAQIAGRSRGTCDRGGGRHWLCHR